MCECRCICIYTVIRTGYRYSVSHCPLCHSRLNLFTCHIICEKRPLFTCNRNFVFAAHCIGGKIMPFLDKETMKKLNSTVGNSGRIHVEMERALRKKDCLTSQVFCLQLDVICAVSTNEKRRFFSESPKYISKKYYSIIFVCIYQSIETYTYTELYND